MLYPVCRRYRLEERYSNPSKSFFKIGKACGKNIKLVLTGRSITKRDSQPANSVWDEIHKLNLAERIIATGFVARMELAALYRSAACSVFPSIYEWFGLPPI